MRTQFFRNSLLLSCMLVLSACGYHLRGFVKIPEQLQKVYLQGASGSLHNEMKMSLKFSDGELVETPEQAGIVIKILRDDMRRRVQSLSSTGKANEFELNYSLRYLLLDRNGKEIAETQELTINRSYFNDQQAILSKNNEENVIRKEMYRQAVRTIFARARAVLQKQNER